MIIILDLKMIIIPSKFQCLSILSFGLQTLTALILRTAFRIFIFSLLSVLNFNDEFFVTYLLVVQDK